MEPLSLVAIAVAFAVALFSLSRAAAARRELAAAHSEIALLRKQLPRSGRASEEQDEAAAEEEELEEEPEAAAEELEEPASEPEAPASLDPAVVARANEILRSARALAQHIGFDHEVKVGDATGVRVTVPVEDEIDESAIAHLRATSPAVLEVGDRDDDRFLIIRR